MESFAQPCVIAGLSVSVIAFLAIILLWQQLHISGLRSTCQGLLKQVEDLLQRQSELQEQRLEMLSALRAERLHVEQLKRKALLLEMAMQDASLCGGRER
ncbi:TPA: hypothetical protein NIG83_005225 [Pseudomonas aeruginosa]|uniref:Uncharacterized protein n=1 Tax=Pseudomonas sihuiensis TaxID=1274359 RepID=A0A1H2LJN5_9PSED|nr:MULTISPECIES: hypothetical protein [Pseudomonas]EQM69650.1 hypothetical protein L682_01610 [Pseudomonas alcaligenes OT 69]MDN4147363.1 hypothetical protein [Pseudomonas tohonis]EKU8043607.1 hypothetical protein [Pseudomonas aeruginosa]EKX2797459.1 hypothetical protein [Pseudomonas aeruginosa]MBF8395159.1 hypothetical protein [Pseudomonas aeruginosa]